MKIRWLGYLLAAGVLLLGGALAWKQYSPDATHDIAKRQPVQISASLTLSPLLLWIAQDQGFFVENGLDVEMKVATSGKTAAEAVLGGEADIAAAAEFLFARKSFKHKDLRILATTTFVHSIRLIGLKERGISRLEDIKGKKIGVALGTNGEFFLARLLTLNGMTRDDITWVDVRPPAMVESIASGAVDAVLIWPPFVQRIGHKLGDKVISFDGQPGQDYFYILLGRQDWLSRNGETARRVMAAVKRAEAWMAENPDAARTYIAKKFKLQEAAVSKALEDYRFFVSLPQFLVTAIEAQARWLEGKGLTGGERAGNYLDMIEGTPLGKVAPDAVTLTMR